MSFLKDIFKKQTAFEVIGGQNLFKKSSANIYKMITENDDGLVKVKGKLYYFLGIDKNINHERSAGKAATGAIVGGLLTGGVGAIAGAAIGGRKKDSSTFYLDFMDYETRQQFTVQVKPIKNTTDISKFRVANPRELE